jgi:hypothetical protein
MSLCQGFWFENAPLDAEYTWNERFSKKIDQLPVRHENSTLKLKLEAKFHLKNATYLISDYHCSFAH